MPASCETKALEGFLIPSLGHLVQAGFSSGETQTMAISVLCYQSISSPLCVGMKFQILSREKYSNINKEASFELDGGLFAGKSWRKVLTYL